MPFPASSFFTILLAMENSVLEQKLMELSGEQKRISCSDARKLAEGAAVDYAEVGRLCDDLGIKIHSCELGCF